MGSSIMASDVHRKLVTDDAVIRNYAEALQRPRVFKLCPTGRRLRPGRGRLHARRAGATAPAWLTIKWWDGDNPATFTTAAVPLVGPTGQRTAARHDRVGHSRGHGQGTITQHLDVVVRRP